MFYRNRNVSVIASGEVNAITRMYANLFFDPAYLSVVSGKYFSQMSIVSYTCSIGDKRCGRACHFGIDLDIPEQQDAVHTLCSLSRLTRFHYVFVNQTYQIGKSSEI